MIFDDNPHLCHYKIYMAIIMINSFIELFLVCTLALNSQLIKLMTESVINMVSPTSAKLLIFKDYLFILLIL